MSPRFWLALASITLPAAPAFACIWPEYGIDPRVKLLHLLTSTSWILLASASVFFYDKNPPLQTRLVKTLAFSLIVLASLLLLVVKRWKVTFEKEIVIPATVPFSMEPFFYYVALVIAVFVAFKFGAMKKSRANVIAGISVAIPVVYYSAAFVLTGVLGTATILEGKAGFSDAPWVQDEQQERNR